MNGLNHATRAVFDCIGAFCLIALTGGVFFPLGIYTIEWAFGLYAKKRRKRCRCSSSTRCSRC